MTSLQFPDTGTRLAILPTGGPAAGRQAIIYADSGGSTRAEIYADSGGSPGSLIANATITTDPHGQLPNFWGPASGTDRLYASVNGGPVVIVDADYNARIDVAALDTAVVHKATTETVTGTKTFNPGALLDKGSVVFDVRAFGALVNGSADDTAALQAAITASTPGARIFIPPGTCIISTTLFPKTGTTIFGVRGKSIVKIKDSVTGFNVFQPTSVTDVVIEDLVIDLNKANTTNPGSNTAGLGVYISVTSGGTGFAVRRVEVKNGWQVGLRFGGHGGQTNPATLNASEVVFDQCNVHDCSQQGIMAINTTDLRITRCQTRNNGQDGIYHSLGRNTVISECTSESNGNHGIVGTYVESCKTIANSCRSNTGWGIAMGGGTSGLQVNLDYIVAGNTCDANGLGGITNDPTITGASTTMQDGRIVVANNICFNNVAAQSGHGIYLHSIRNAAVNGNVSFSNGGSGLALHGGYFAAAGNVCFSNTVYGIDLQGIGTEDVLGHHRLGTNLLYNNTLGQLNIAGSVTDVGIVDPTTLRMASGSTIGFYGTTPIAKPTGVAITAAGVHAALVSLGLIAA